MTKVGLHKQWTNRPLEWQQEIKVVVTSTEWENFFNLRLDSKTVQPEMVELARMIKHEIELTPEVELQPGEWHLPYITTARSPTTGSVYYYANRTGCLSLEDAKKISVSCCAQVSYRNLDMSLAKAEKVIKMLTKADDPHLSPFEHQATPMTLYDEVGPIEGWEKGVTHMDKNAQFWSGNFQGWIQNRQLMEV